jgi:membrane protein
VLDFAISLGLLSFLFAAIYKILPDKEIAWADVAIGSVVTALLFTIGKSLIGLYIGSSQIASSYGAAGALIVILLWVYYSAQIFLFGAEFTRVYAEHHGTHADQRARTAEGAKTNYDGAPATDRAIAAPARPPSVISQILGAGLVALVLILHARNRNHRPASG